MKTGAEHKLYVLLRVTGSNVKTPELVILREALALEGGIGYWEQVQVELLAGLGMAAKQWHRETRLCGSIRARNTTL